MILRYTKKLHKKLCLKGYKWLFSQSQPVRNNFFWLRTVLGIGQAYQAFFFKKKLKLKEFSDFTRTSQCL